MKRFFQMIALATAFSVLASGCFGSFPLLRKLHAWNASFDGKWAQEGVFLVLIIIPVYEVVAVVDALVLNSVEFWSGKPATGISMLEDGTEVETSVVSPDVLRVKRTLRGEVLDEFEIVRVSDHAGMLRRVDGTVLSTAEMLPDGAIATGGPSGTLTVITADQVAQLSQSAQRGTLIEDARSLMGIQGALAAR